MFIYGGPLTRSRIVSDPECRIKVGIACWVFACRGLEVGADSQGWAK